jgi:hypothetical protein
LEPEPPRADQQLVGCDAHLGEVCKEFKRAFEASVVGFGVIYAETALAKSANISRIWLRACGDRR